MLREYLWRGNTWQFEETEAPAGAVLIAPRKPKSSGGSKKAAPRRNKAAAAKENKTEG